MADRDVAADRITFAIRERRRSRCSADYDCDGITSAAIMTGVIDALGGQVVPLLASRFDGGYGVSPAAVERIAATRSQAPRHVRLRLLRPRTRSRDVRKRGVDVIVIDHHLVPDEPLPVVAFLNPHRPECGFPVQGARVVRPRALGRAPPFAPSSVASWICATGSTWWPSARSPTWRPSTATIARWSARACQGRARRAALACALCSSSLVSKRRVRSLARTSPFVSRRASTRRVGSASPTSRSSSCSPVRRQRAHARRRHRAHVR